mmetsp:Transcript_25628/g.41558  ORF Transcript_25628/g.41558 Transcript_25628/m.41558 type:complete len:246 (-) Transcript_25628:681-1418(-)
MKHMMATLRHIAIQRSSKNHIQINLHQIKDWHAERQSKKANKRLSQMDLLMLMRIILFVFSFLDRVDRVRHGEGAGACPMQYGAPSVQCEACGLRLGTHPCLPAVAQAHRTPRQLHLQFHMRHMGHMRHMRQTTWCRSSLLVAGFVAQVQVGGPPGTTHLWGLRHGMAKLPKLAKLAKAAKPAKAGSQTSSSMPSRSIPQAPQVGRGRETPEIPIHSPMTWKQRPCAQRAPRNQPQSLRPGNALQ